MKDIQEAVTQLLAWATSDEGKRFRKKIWDRKQLKWLSFTGKRPFSELLDDIAHASTDELDHMLKVYSYKDDPISGATYIAGIRTDPFSGKEICMKGDTYIYREATTFFPLLGKVGNPTFPTSYIYHFSHYSFSHFRSCHYKEYYISSTCFSNGNVSLQGTYAAMVSAVGRT
jgi:hypothetical protein